jgi:hypothetical protein
MHSGEEDDRGNAGRIFHQGLAGYRHERDQKQQQVIEPDQFGIIGHDNGEDTAMLAVIRDRSWSFRRDPRFFFSLEQNAALLTIDGVVGVD